MKINPDVLLTGLLLALVVAITVMTLASQPVPDVFVYIATTAIGALVARMVPGARATSEAPVYTPQLAAAIETARTEQPAPERRAAQPEDRPWETR